MDEKKVLQTLYTMMKDRGYYDPPRIKNKMYIFSADSLPTLEMRLFQEDKIGIGHITPSVLITFLYRRSGLLRKHERRVKIISYTKCL